MKTLILIVDKKKYHGKILLINFYEVKVIQQLYNLISLSKFILDKMQKWDEMSASMCINKI